MLHRRLVNLGSTAILTLFALTELSAFGEIIPADRRITWQGNVGVANGIPNVTTIYTTLNPSGGDDTAAIRNALNSCPSNQVAKLNSGTFVITGDIDYQTFGNGKVLRGNGPANTRIRMDGGRFYVRSSAKYNNIHVPLSSNAAKGDTVLHVSATPSWARPGWLYFISQLDDNNYVSHVSQENADEKDAMWYITGEERAMCQVNRLIATNATTMTFEEPMLWNYSTAKSAQIDQGAYNASFGPRSRCGFEDFTIVGNYANGNTHTFQLENADSCWFTNVVVTNMIGRNGIHFDFSYRCTVSHCYVGYSHAYSGGQGYGIAMYNISDHCLIENSIFEHLHAGVDQSYSSSGNAIAYNLFLTGFSDSGQAPAIATHAVHNAFNLYEGNWCQEKITADITHGSSSHGTIFRNRINGHGFGGGDTPVILQQYNRYYNVIGNILGEANYHNGYDDAISGAQYGCSTSHKVIFDIGCGLSPEDSISVNAIQRHVNAVFTSATAVIVGDASYKVSDLSDSYYLSSKPSWFGSLNWPAYSPATTSAAALSYTNIPAGYRYAFGKEPAIGSVGKPLPPDGLRLSVP